MTSTRAALVERVARVIDPDGWSFADEERRDFPADPHEKIYGTPRLMRSRTQALAAIRAVLLGVREPSEGVLSQLGDDVHWGYSCHVCGGLTEGWTAMIDALLAEIGG